MIKAIKEAKLDFTLFSHKEKHVKLVNVIWQNPAIKIPSLDKQVIQLL